MDSYALLKTVHVLSSTILFGTGVGTAFHGLMAGLSGSPQARAVANRNVVRADWLFTTPAVVVQPVTGVWLARTAGFPLSTSWIVTAIVLYVLVGACWLPVVWIQIQMRRITDALPEGASPPPRYRRLERWWFALGWPAFAAMTATFWLMIAKPDLW